MGDALIDLGEVTSAGSDEADAALPRAPQAYRWILGFLTAVLVAVLGGAVPPPPPPPGPKVIPLTLSDALRVNGGRLHVIGPATRALGRPAARQLMNYTIRSYDLPGVNLLGTYTATVDGDLSYIGDGVEGTLLYSYQGNITGGVGVAAVRPGSDKPIWERYAFLYGVSRDRGTALAFEHVTEKEGTEQEWVGLDTRTGETRWRVRQPTGGHLTLRVEDSYLAAYPERIYTLAPGGRIEAWDTATGRVVAVARTAMQVNENTQFWGSGGVVLVGNPDGGTVAYDDADLTERWRRPAPGLSENTFPYPCGPVICVAGRETGSVAIDPASGRELWRNDSWDFSEPVGDRLLVGNDSQVEPELAVVDPWTGRAVEAGPWIGAGPGPEPGTAYVYRIRIPDYQLRYGVLDLATGKARVLGTAERIAGDCQFESGTLICRRLDSSVGVWRL